MKFHLVDAISEFEPGQRVVAVKSVSLAEEYLADHFPTFPVLPGVLMLELAVQAAAWVVREQNDFATPLVLLKEARNVTYRSFVAPGRTLTMTCTCKELTPEVGVFAAEGAVAEQAAFKGRLVLRHRRLTDLDARLADAEAQLVAAQRQQFERLRRGQRSPGALVV